MSRKKVTNFEMKLLEYSISYLIGTHIIENNNFPKEIYTNMFLRFDESQKRNLYFFITQQLIKNLTKYDVRLDFKNVACPLDKVCESMNENNLSFNTLIINDLLEWQKLAKLFSPSQYLQDDNHRRYIKYFSYENEKYIVKQFYF